MTGSHPVQLDVEYPDRALNRLTTAFRILHHHPDRDRAMGCLGRDLDHHCR